MITAQKLLRAEIWDKPQAGAGVRLAILADLSRLQVSAQLAGDDVLDGTIALSSASVPELLVHRILRIDDGTTFDEWIISSVKKNSVTGLLEFAAAPLSELLGYRALVGQTDGLGVVRYNFDLVGLKPSEIIDAYVLPALVASGVTWVARGVIDQDVATDITFDWDTPLSVLKTLASRQGLELQLRRNGVVGYYIDLITAIGSTAGVVDVRYAKNLLSHEQQRVVDQQVTRAFPRGADEEGFRATMARATWRVASVAGNVVGLADPLGGDGPIMFDSQLVGNYLRTATGALSQVTASSAGGQTVTVVSAAGVAVNDLIQFRLNAAGHDLTFLTSPADEASDAKTIVGALDLPDVPSTNNVISNPALRNWSAGLPVGWAKIGVPTVVTQQLAVPFVRTAGSSARVQATADGEGLVTSAGKVFPLAGAPYISGYGSFWVVSGKVRVELVLTHAGGPTVIPIPPQYATSDKIGEWVDVGVSAYNAYAPDVITAVAVRIVAHQGAAEFYVDAAQVTETPGHKPFVEGSGGTRLWQLANERLRLYSGLFVTEAIDAVDLYRLDGTKWAESKVELGAQIRVTDARMSAPYQTRIVSFTRDYFTDGSMSVVLSTRPEDLTGSLAKPTRPARLTLVTPGETGDGTGPSIVASSIETDFDVTLNYLISADTAWYTVDDGANVPLAIGSGQLVITRDTPGGLTKKYVLTAERASQQFSYPMEVSPMTVDPGYLSPTGSVVKADKLSTPRTIWGQSFDGSANVSGAFSGATTGAFSGDVTGHDFILGAGTGGDPGDPGSPVSIRDEGTEVTPDVTSIDFVGPGVAVSSVGSAVTVDVTPTWGALTGIPRLIFENQLNWSSPQSINDLRSSMSFAYPNAGAPSPSGGGLISFGGYSGGYDTQIHGGYNTTRLWFRNRNGDSNVWNAWREVATIEGDNALSGLNTFSNHLRLGTGVLVRWGTGAVDGALRNSANTPGLDVVSGDGSVWGHLSALEFVAQSGTGYGHKWGGSGGANQFGWYADSSGSYWRDITSSHRLLLGALNSGALVLYGNTTAAAGFTVNPTGNADLALIPQNPGNSAYTRLVNTAGSFYMGTDNSSGSTFGSAWAYAMIFYTPVGLAMQIHPSTNEVRVSSVLNVASANGLAIGSISNKNRIQWNSSYFQLVSTANVVAPVQASSFWATDSLALRNDALTVNYGAFARYAAWLGSGTNHTPTFGAYSGFGFYWSVNGSTDIQMQMTPQGTLLNRNMVRATGWYNSETGSSLSGAGAEMGSSSGFAYFEGFNRDTGAYIPTIVQGSTVTLYATINSASLFTQAGVNHWYNHSNGSNGGWVMENASGIQGYLYWDAGGFGLLPNNGTGWGVRVKPNVSTTFLGGSAPIATGNSSSGYPIVGYNFYGTNVSGGWAYEAGDFAQGIFFHANVMRFYITASGSAGGAISWAEQMAITYNSRIDTQLDFYAKDVHASRTDTTGVIYFGNQGGGSRYLYYDGSRYLFAGAAVVASDFVLA